MKKTIKPRVVAKRRALPPKKLAAKAPKARKAQSGTTLAEAVAQLSLITKKLTAAADKLAGAAMRLSAVPEGGQKRAESPERSATSETPPEKPATPDDATEEYVDITERYR